MNKSFYYIIESIYNKLSSFFYLFYINIVIISFSYKIYLQKFYENSLEIVLSQFFEFYILITDKKICSIYIIFHIVLSKF